MKPAETKVEPLAKDEVPAAESPVKKPAEDNQAAVSTIPVKRGDSLSKIANRTKASDVSLERMLVALYRANTEAFDGHNMNRLRIGKILRLPEAGDLNKVQQAEAVNEVRAQVDDWNAYRQKLAGANISGAEQQVKQEVAGKISTSIADKAPAVKESAKEVLKLSKGEEVGDKVAAGGKAMSARDKAIAKEEDSIAKAKALKEAEQRTALLEKNVKDMQRLVELKNQAAALSEQSKKGAASAPASALPLIASSVKAASAVAEAKPKVVAPPPSLLDEFLENPVYMGGSAAVLAGLLGLVALRRKKKGDKSEPVSHADLSGVTEQIAEPIQSPSDIGDFTGAAAIGHEPAAAEEDEVDPIGEADLFLNFGRDVQAEEVLKEALQKDPSNNQIRLKLLSIYAARKDEKSFYVYALEIKESHDETSWEQAAAMGRELEPGNALYVGDADSAQLAAASVENPVVPAVDFDLGFDEPEAALPDIAQSTIIEQDTPTAEERPVAPIAELNETRDEAMDFDVSGALSDNQAVAIEEPAPEEPKLDIALDFDITGTQPESQPEKPEEPALDVPAMDFDVADIQAVAPAAPVEQTPLLDLDDLVFDTTPSSSVATPADDADTAMEFSIDFPTEEKTAVAAPTPPVKDVGLSEISLNLDDTPAEKTSPAVEAKDENWQEVATKLDLAKAYQEMGDQAGAREILEEVLRDGDTAQRETAQDLLLQLS